jgi:glycosyltransferase involved in cell wall biosynthesis
MRKVDVILNGWDLHHGVAGVSVYLRLLCEGLMTERHQLAWRVAVPRPCLEAAAFLPRENILVIEGREVRGLTTRDLYWNRQVAVAARRLHPEALLHSVFHFWAPGAAGRLLVTAHDCIEMRASAVAQRNFLRRVHRRLCWSTVRHARGVIAISRWTRQDLISLAGVAPSKIFLHYNWIRPDCLKPTSLAERERVRLRYQLPPAYIAYVGGYRSYKNVEFLMRAWKKASALAPLPPLVLAGKIPEDSFGRFYSDVNGTLARESLTAAQIIRPGLIADEDLPAFYAGASLFVSPSKLEGFGYPALEALACGAPVLVSDCAAYRELFPDPGQRFPDDDEDHLAKKLHESLAQPERYRASLPLEFRAAAGVNRYEQIVSELTAGPASRRAQRVF